MYCFSFPQAKYEFFSTPDPLKYLAFSKFLNLAFLEVLIGVSLEFEIFFYWSIVDLQSILVLVVQHSDSVF